MIQRFAAGQNYSIDLEGSRAVCRVWSRPDLDSSQGAALAVEKIKHFQRLALGNAQGSTPGAGQASRLGFVRDMLFDLTQAPAVTGPKTQEALGQMMSAWEQAGKHIAVVSGPHSVQQLQLRRLVTTFAPQHGGLFGSIEEGNAWLDACAEQ